MKDFICKKCGNTTYIMQEKLNGTGKAIGLYCAKCGTWHKWLNKQEKVLCSTHSAEIDKDKEIARLTAENDNLTVELEVAQRDVENLTRTLEETNEEIEVLEAENAELRATLSKMETVEKELRARLDKAIDKELVAKELAHIFDCPCNFSPLEEEMWAYCRDNCVDDNVECWIRVINKKCEELKGEKE